jgi:hypothetical protein
MKKIKSAVLIALMALTMSTMTACGNTNTGTNSAADNTAGTTNDTATGTVNNTDNEIADNTTGTTVNGTTGSTIGDEADNVNDVTAGDYEENDSLLDDAGEVVGDVGNTAADIIDDTANGVENAVDDVTNDTNYSATGTSTSSRTTVR